MKMDSNETLSSLETNPKLIRERLTLDFDSRSSRKRQHQQTTNVNGNNPATTIWTPSNAVLLESPDIKMCKLGTPELERFLISSGSHLTPTPSLVPSNSLALMGSSNNVSNVTEAQEQYAKPFVDALERLKSQQIVSTAIPTTITSTLTTSNNLNNCNNTNNHVNSNSSSSPAPGSLNKSNTSPVPSPYPTTIHLKTEIIDDDCNQSHLLQQQQHNQQYNQSSPPVSPINMEDQERIKLERKRLRNRIAASKCRKRKLERISKLEDKVRLLKNENNDLASSVGKLRDHVCRLKQEYLEHVKQGCMLHNGSSFN